MGSSGVRLPRLRDSDPYASDAKRRSPRTNATTVSLALTHGVRDDLERRPGWTSATFAGPCRSRCRSRRGRHRGDERQDGFAEQLHGAYSVYVRKRRRVAVASRRTGPAALLLFGQRCNESSSLAMRDSADVARKIRDVHTQRRHLQSACGWRFCRRDVPGVLDGAQRINSLLRSVPQTVDGSCLLVMYPAEDRSLICCGRVQPNHNPWTPWESWAGGQRLDLPRDAVSKPTRRLERHGPIAGLLACLTSLGAPSYPPQPS